MGQGPRGSFLPHRHFFTLPLSLPPTLSHALIALNYHTISRDQTQISRLSRLSRCPLAESRAPIKPTRVDLPPISRSSWGGNTAPSRDIAIIPFMGLVSLTIGVLRNTKSPINRTVPGSFLYPRSPLLAFSQAQPSGGISPRLACRMAGIMLRRVDGVRGPRVLSVAPTLQCEPALVTSLQLLPG